jgi:formylglycine-generating enzyme required for sulfatase activity
MSKALTISVLVLLFLVLPLSAENRTALVIGNGSYTRLPALAQPVAEARQMKEALESIGFTVIFVQDASRKGIMEGVRLFNEELNRKGGIAFFHYGGHGIQTGGRNWLIPVDADISAEWEVEATCVDVNYVLAAMEDSVSTSNIIVLDACRDNPLTGSGRSSVRGFARMDAPENTIIVYSANEGETAQDGLFTPILIRRIREGGMEFSDMIKVVRKEVFDASGGKQRPAEYSMLMGDIWLDERRGSFDTGVVSGGSRGSLIISVKTAGEVWLDGVRKTALLPGEKASIEGVPAGKHVVEMRYAGQEESRTVNVSADKVLALDFSWERPPLPKDLVAVKGGPFEMGSSPREPGRRGDETLHTVTVSPFSIGATEVTVGEFRKFVNDTGYRTTAETAGGGWVWNGFQNEFTPGLNWMNPGFEQTERNPVVLVSWVDCAVYCNWRSNNEGLKPCYAINGVTVACDFSAGGYRLPTEAEWEFAAKGGDNLVYSWGNSAAPIDISANLADETVRRRNPELVALSGYNDGYPFTAPVGQYKPNPFGLYDLSGNVWEWCQDWYGPYATGKQSDPKGPVMGENRVMRGGAWYNPPGDCRSAIRIPGHPLGTFNMTGFRLVRRAD